MRKKNIDAARLEVSTRSTKIAFTVEEKKTQKTASARRNVCGKGFALGADYSRINFCFVRSVKLYPRYQHFYLFTQI